MESVSASSSKDSFTIYVATCKTPFDPALKEISYPVDATLEDVVAKVQAFLLSEVPGKSVKALTALGKVIARSDSPGVLRVITPFDGKVNFKSLFDAYYSEYMVRGPENGVLVPLFRSVPK
jgi:hypothetical protein